MPYPVQIKTFDRLPGFDADVLRLTVTQKSDLLQIVASLMNFPVPKSLRHHQLNGHNPKIWVIDVYPNHSYQATMHLVGTHATLRRVATHKVISRSP